MQFKVVTHRPLWWEMRILVVHCLYTLCSQATILLIPGVAVVFFGTDRNKLSHIRCMVQIGI